MRGRQNILAFNLPENNSDSLELSGSQSVISTSEGLLHEEALLPEGSNGGGGVQLHCFCHKLPMSLYSLCDGCFFSGSTN